MDTQVNQCFSYGYVSWCILFSDVPLKDKWFRECRLQPWQHTLIIIEKIGFPSAVCTNTVCPTYAFLLRQMLLIVGEEMWRTFDIGYSLCFTKHQESCYGKTFFACLTVSPVATQHTK